ncbi:MULTISPECIES: bifunctional helix-turn-helix transcriptional regulator/GNAT family N-acetyltransferase [unclassified Chelatococcus]|uniref:bifunctional helix-turn-helix transcriptional regulator/GNAT family N-acetyltransferase n=1 Tax=unclassified Chelatococcus TaxID=2638111 RepID=UPI0020BEC0E5|nr:MULTISPECIES: bifunctional helix-turn-helix transcriptional regulator/GNAT family N-acetyltransferase [unclassified Chelatococcus]MCO5075912.1 bifunctional helix-turn-helix transcriptional regulator/GNAT family N-acetyltransferase [Chelatococcus sp.]CAH1649034.1 MarR family transcriptional regulator with acetyltransferase activity [Hyphomicrobiales bacterium]CAH1667728.1 MarR family transcriptional regulator with acetyltransferase activity [Hyphomicrobiales bacterium]
MSPLSALHSIDAIRAASRQLVREFGFMGGAFAGTDLSPSAVHALIELDGGGITARDLAERLHLEKSSISRMLRKLVASGHVREEAGDDDGRVKMLSLTASGKERVDAIHAFARGQVVDALGRLRPGQEHTVLEGLSLYANALAAQANGEAGIPASDIGRGYRPGLIARLTQMHALYYARVAGFGQRFESVVASGAAEFCGRLESPRNAIWTAVLDGTIIGTVAIDGEDLGGDIAHLRWFIVDDTVRNSGVGRRLLGAALAFVDEQGFAETHLWTFSGLEAARHLYEKHGFVCAEEWTGAQWGQEVLEQRFVRVRL